MNENGVLRSYPEPSTRASTRPTSRPRRAVELIDDASPGDQPFFLSLWYVAPHRGAPRDPDDPRRPGTPSPAPRHRDAYAGVRMPRHPNFNEANMYDKPQVVADRPRIYGEFAAGIQENWRQEIETLMGVDEGVAQIVEALRRNGELDNTLIVYMSDNGFMHGEHRALAEKVLPYEESIRVPLVMRGPGVPSGRLDRRLVDNVDVPATILDAADAAPGRVLDGRSLLELLADPGAEWGRDILIENGNGANGVPAYRGIRTYRFMYVEHRTTGEYELYDLENDPYELQSVDGFARYAKVQRDLRSRLRALDACVGLDCLARPHLTLVGALGRAAGEQLLLRGTSASRCAARSASRLLHADVMVGRRRVERLLNIPTARGSAAAPVTLSGARARGSRSSAPRPLPPPGAGGDGRRPQAHARPRAAPLRLRQPSTRLR